MIVATTAILTLITEGVVGALAEKLTDEVASKLRGEPAKQALRQAIGAAIQRYATSGARLDLAAPLLHPNGLLTQPAVAEELAQVIRPDHEPNLMLIGDRWRAALDESPTWRDFTEEARLFVSYLQAELRNTEVFRPVFDSRSLDEIASDAALSAERLATIEAQLTNLAGLIDARLGELVRTFNTAPYGIRDQIRDYSRYIEEKTRGFVGRQFVFDAIKQFTQQNSRGYFIIRGDPGIGKSALTAQFVKISGLIHHFNIRAEGISKADQFLRNICAQLIARYQLNHTVIPTDTTQDAGFFNQLLGEVSDQLGDKDQTIIVVDALDEVDNLGASPGTNPLFLPITLPRGVYIVTTTRKVPLNLRIECEQQTLDIEQDSAGNLADVRKYVEQAVNRAGIQEYITKQNITAQQFVHILVHKSQGNFMYLRYVLPEIEHGAYTDLNLEALPAGLRNYYEDHWRRMRGQDENAWFEYKLPIVMALTVVKEPVSIDLISDFAGVEQRARIRTVLQEWQQFLYEERVSYEDGLQKRYRIYHASFHDFIEDKEEVADERVSRKDANKKISDKLWVDLFGDTSPQIRLSTTPVRLEITCTETSGQEPLNDTRVYAWLRVDDEDFDIDGDEIQPFTWGATGPQPLIFKLNAHRTGHQSIRVEFYHESTYLGAVIQSIQIRRDQPEANIQRFAATLTLCPNLALPDLLIRFYKAGVHIGDEIYSYRVSSPRFASRPLLAHKGDIRLTDPARVLQPVRKELNIWARKKEANIEDLHGRLVRLGTDLYTKLAPPDLDTMLRQLPAECQSVQIISDVPVIPWELLRPASTTVEPQPSLAQRFALTRWHPDAQAAAPSFRLNQVSIVLGHTQQTYLPAAEAEATALQRLLGAAATRIEPQTLWELLRRGNFDALHIISHGIPNEDNADESYVELGGGTMLRASDLGGFRWEERRPLIFVNACEVGREGLGLTGFGGWAPAVVARARAGAFVGALWEATDGSAGLFAEAFFGQLQAGVTIGEALRKARLAIMTRPDPTWLCYIVYAHPNAMVGEGRVEAER